MQPKIDKSAKITKGKGGRQRLSNLSDKEQARLRMEKIREERRKENLVAVEVLIPKSQHNSLRKKGYNLSAAAREAFALLLKSKRRKPAESTEDVYKRPRLEVDLDNPPMDGDWRAFQV